MALLEWSDEYSVKVRELDEQHKQLITMINRLHEAMLTNRGREVQREIAAEMISYVELHFASEEEYMLRFNYDGYEEHLREHEQFTAEAIELKVRVANGTPVLTLEFLTLLKSWLQHHILGTDMKYAGHFNAHGLT